MSSFTSAPKSAASAADDEVVRAVGVLGLVAVAVIHLVQISDTFDESASLAVGFILLSVACVVLAGRLLRRATMATWIAVAVLNALIILGYVATRMVSSGLDDDDVGNWSEALGVASLVIEGLLVLLAVYAVVELSRRSDARAERQHREFRAPA